MFIEQAYTGKNNWYLYLFTILVVFFITQIGSLPLMLYLLHTNPEALQNGLINFTDTNWGLALTLLPFLCGFFAIFFCIQYFQQKQPLSIVTGRPTFNWQRFFFGAGIWAAISLVIIFISIYTEKEVVFQFNAPKFAGLLIISLLLLPFQTAFEEILFRGYLQQGLFLLFKSKWLALILTAILFGLMHGANPEVENFGMEIALPQYIAMGLLLGYIAYKDNGLELAIGLHAANNIIASVVLTSDASALQTNALFKDLNPTASHLDTLILIMAGILFIAICNRKYRLLHDELK
ncbi:CPBP family intramembrane glutamic endopeptidase [Odoribacter lunatus]|uniref:CPBP family intramembrane glutamic endopeptidase n=1 Tax=Odoribacter lunatus TaxID=2941335 RepID=UPI0020418789|nr:type II CAAX endopeptidase family protein [Odoribacter lunatus]